MIYFHLPSRKEKTQILLIAIFPISIWAIFIFFHDLPAYIMHYQIAEIVGIMAYMLVFSLFESIAVAGVLIFLASIAPKQWFFNRFISQGLLIILVTTLWVAWFQFWYWSQRIQPQGIQEGDAFNYLSIGLPLLLWLITYLIALISLSIYLQRSRKLEKVFLDIADRIVVPSSIFLAAELLSVIIILARNLL